MNPSQPFRPCLLRETAEIALTEIKRFFEPRFADEFSLRRVSAPLFLPVSSPDLDPGEVVKFRIPGADSEMAIVRGLSRWLRSQLVRYDIAPGFGVFTVMNALQPEVTDTATTTPHLAAWAWQQTIAPDRADQEYLETVGKRIYHIFRQTEQMILEKFPHLEATLPERLHVAEASAIHARMPDATPRRAEYDYQRSMTHTALLVLDADLSARILVWNPIVRCPLTLATFAIQTDPEEVSSRRTPEITSLGGNILRDPLAMQILHQPQLLR